MATSHFAGLPPTCAEQGCKSYRAIKKSADEISRMLRADGYGEDYRGSREAIISDIQNQNCNGGCPAREFDTYLKTQR